MTISGSNLPGNQSVELTWSTANVTWMVDPEPDTVNYLGRCVDRPDGGAGDDDHERERVRSASR